MQSYYTFNGVGRPYTMARPSDEAAEFLKNSYSADFLNFQKKALEKAIAGDSADLEQVRSKRRISEYDLSSVRLDEVFSKDLNRMRIYRPKSGAKTQRRAVLYLHGGGWAINSPETCERFCRDIVLREDLVVVAPDYHLAPENKYPASCIDAKRAYGWMLENGGRLGIDVEKIFLAGDSSGGHLAFHLAIDLRDDAAPMPAGVIAFYPPTDLISTRERKTFNIFGEGYSLNGELMELFIKAYAPDEKSLEGASLLNKNLSGLPPSLIVMGECDILRDEAQEFYAKLSNLSKSRYVCFEGAVHAFITQKSMDGAYERALCEFGEFIRRN